MDHPIRGTGQVSLRRKLAALLRSKYDLTRHDSVIFVCGGNELDHARTRFLCLAKDRLKDFDLFTPESALKDTWQTPDGPFDLTEFEELVANISYVIVIFPESPGSFCETGYFAAKESLNKKTLLVIDAKFQKHDSFISTGPVHRVNEGSDFRPTQFIDYRGEFEEVIARIVQRKPRRFRQAIQVSKYNELSFIHKMALIQKLVDIVRLATIDDIIFLFKSAFKAQVSERELRSLIAVLRGSNYLLVSDTYGHLYVNNEKHSFVEIRDGSKAEETEVRMEIANIIDRDEAFNSILMAVNNVT